LWISTEDRTTVALLAQLDAVIAEWVPFANYGSALYELGGIEITRFVTRARAAIHRVAGNPSVYVTQCEEIIETNAGMPRGHRKKPDGSTRVAAS